MTPILLINGAFGLAPVLIFLAMLIQLDSFKLVRFAFVRNLILAGAGAAMLSYLGGRALIEQAGVDVDFFVSVGGPILEEALKAAIVVYLIRANRIGFVFDAVIAGFAIGAGFAVLENYLYLQVIGDRPTAIWVVRGFGTAIMHGGATAIFALLAQVLTPQRMKGTALRFTPAFVGALVLHIVFNHFRFYPVTSTILIMSGLAIVLGVVLHRGRKSIDNWLNVDFDGYRRLLAENRITGQLDSLRLRLDPSEVREIIQYAEMHAELVLFAEEVLKAESRGETIDVDDSMKATLAHFHYLEERIGRAVKLVLGEHLQFSRYEFYQLYKLQRDAGDIAPLAHHFNDDLLLNEEDHAAAKKEYPAIFFALDNPPLRDVFKPIDERANASKGNSKLWGVVAVYLATAALLVAGAEPLYRGLPSFDVRIIAGLGGLAAIASLLMGVFGATNRERKTRWLADRLATERLRQFHFQYYIMNAQRILDGANDLGAAQDYLKRRREAVERYAADALVNVDEELHTIVHDEDCGEGLFEEGKPPPIRPGGEAADYFNAYARLRFEPQLNYCNHVLRESKGLFKQSAARRAHILSLVTFAGVLGLLAMHMLVFVGVLADVEWIKSPIVHVAAMSSAIIALSARTFDEGFQPNREIERMRHYRVQLRRIHSRFRNADDPNDKIAAMLEFEKLAYQEIVLFLKSNYEAQFVL